MTEGARAGPIREVAIVEGDPARAGELERDLRAAGAAARRFSRGADLLEWLARSRGATAAAAAAGAGTPSVVLVGVELGDMPAADLVRRIGELRPGTVAVAIAGEESLGEAADCVSAGAYSYLLRPLSEGEVESMLARIAEEVLPSGTERGVADPGASAPGASPQGDPSHGIIGRHPATRRLVQLVERVGGSGPGIRHNVCIVGESGTGKELVARAIHRLAAPAGAPFVAVNCAAINANLLEDQLFGHVRGAFTGAAEDREGVFVAAGEGTVFLDEITEISLELQAKLLRAIQEREVCPLGADRPVSWDAGLVAATNRDIKSLTDRGDFRIDLYHRINVIRIDVPPLRQRLADVDLLVEFFLDRHARARGARKRISRAALELLRRHDYPGNVRELENAIEHACAVSRGSTILPQDLPLEIREREARAAAFKPLDVLEREHVLEALRAAGGRKARAARLLQVDRNRLYRLIRRHAIEPREIDMG